MELCTLDIDKFGEKIKQTERNLILANQQIENLKCYMRTLDAYTNIQRACPQCRKYILIEGFVCFGCGYDSTE